MATIIIKAIPDELWRKVRLRCFEYGITAKEFTISALTEAISGKREEGKPDISELVKESPIDKNVFSHDSKLCRIYKCGQCQELGIKDGKRGL